MNLLVTLDTLLSEGSVVGAAQRMNLSAPAMSRQLDRIRRLLGDPVFVRAGRGLVPTPRAQAVRAPLRLLIQEANSIVRGGGEINLSTLDRTFVLRTDDGFASAFGATLAAVIAKEAPNVRLRFAPQGQEDVGPLREGNIDLDIGVIGAMGPEVRMQAIIHDRHVSVVRRGHPLAGQAVKPKAFATFPHISVSRRGRFEGPIDIALAGLGLQRSVCLTVANFADALSIVRSSDFIVSLPDRLTNAMRADLITFDLPVKTEAIVISMAWHPRFDADPSHRWFRSCVRAVCPAP